MMIDIKELKKNYGRKTVFDGFTLTVEKGEMIAIMGPSGCGKSTLLNIIGLIDNFDEGMYSFQGKQNIKINSRESEKMIRDKISYLFQNFALVDSQTVEENLLLALYYVKKSKAEKKAMISAALKEVGLPSYESYKVFELSGGEQQRVAVARAILKPSDLILADEPTGSLDDVNKFIILDLLKNLNLKGKTIIMVTHDQEVADVCSRIITL